MSTHSIIKLLSPCAVTDAGVWDGETSDTKGVWT